MSSHPDRTLQISKLLVQTRNANEKDVVKEDLEEFYELDFSFLSYLFKRFIHMTFAISLLVFVGEYSLC